MAQTVWNGKNMRTPCGAAKDYQHFLLHQSGQL